MAGAFTLQGFESPEETQARIGKAEMAAMRPSGNLADRFFQSGAQRAGALGGAIATSMGYEDPAVKRSTQLKDMSMGSDVSTSEGMFTLAQKLIDNGFTSQGLSLVKQAQGLQDNETDARKASSVTGARPYVIPKEILLPEGKNGELVAFTVPFNARTGEWDMERKQRSQQGVGFKGRVAESKSKGIVKGREEQEASLDLPKIKSDGVYLTGIIDKIVSHESFSDVVGQPVNMAKLGQYVSGTSASDFKLLQDQLTGQTFMTAYKTLKGGGQITEIEGTKATDSLNRMKTSSSEEAYLEAAKEFKKEIKRFERLAEIRAGMSPVDVKLDQKSSEKASQVAKDKDGKRVFNINGVWKYSNGKKYGG